MYNYGTLFIDNTKYALETAHIQEILVNDGALETLQEPIQYGLGTIELRGLMIPIIDIHPILKIAQSNMSCSKVVILKKNKFVFGIPVTEAGHILSIKKDEILTNDEQDGNKLIAKSFRQKNNERVQVIDFDELCDAIHTDKLENHRVSNTKHKKVDENLGFVRCITFAFGQHKFAIPMTAVRELVLAKRLEKCNFKDKFCSGRFTIRGINMPVINPSTISEFDDENTIRMDTQHMLVIVKEQGKYAAFCADRIIGIIDYPSSEIEQVHANEPEEKGNKQAISRVEYQYLDISKIFSSPSIMALTHKYHIIFGTQNLEGFVKDASARNLFLAFESCYTFAFNIERILGIVKYDSSIEIDQHNNKPHVANMVLRDKPTPIIDFSLLYSLGGCRNNESVIIIIKNGDDQYGFLVDKLKTVLNITNRNKIHVHELLRPMIETHCWEDVQEIVQVESSIANAEHILIMDTEMILKRASVYKCDA